VLNGRGRMMTFDEFAIARLPALLRFAKVLCVERGLAEDIVQDVLLRAQLRWEKIGQLDHPEAYVRRMIVNEFLSWRRRRPRMIPFAKVAERDHVPDPAVSHADRELLAVELAKLPRRQRAVLVLRYYGGLTDEEIAQELGCSAGTVRSHLSRALAALRIEMAGTTALAKEA
jgi:RNA polymerase sigma-70 factor (sigma-E family)